MNGGDVDRKIKRIIIQIVSVEISLCDAERGECCKTIIVEENLDKLSRRCSVKIYTYPRAKPFIYLHVALRIDVGEKVRDLTPNGSWIAL